MHKKIRKAVFLVDGLGTRFLPVTKSMPKEMLPVLNKPFIMLLKRQEMQGLNNLFLFR
ncbi:MAG: hypothetical protein MTP17_00825 [Candidatus Midichloria sp.]|nr:MAG: hypothetical protein MTP17_00825 [Candidatus Midichloria sp.]